MARLLKEMIILGMAAGAALYLMFPSLLPDFLPLIGWIDEGAATVVLLNTFRYYGIDLTDLYNRKPQDAPPQKVVRRVRRVPKAQIEGQRSDDAHIEDAARIEDARYQDVDRR